MNSQHITVMHNTESTVVHVCWHKNWPCLKIHDLTDDNRQTLQQRKCQLFYVKRVDQLAERQTHPPGPKTVLENSSSELSKVNTQKFTYDWRKTNEVHSKYCPLDSILGKKQNEDIQINNNTKILCQ